MLALYVLIGFFIGNQTSKLLKNKDISKEKERKTNQYNSTDKPSIDGSGSGSGDGTNNKHTKHHNIRIKKRMKKYFSINSNSPEGIDPEKISVDIKKKSQERNKSSPEPSFIPLSILWAHYVAKQLGILNKKEPSPWQIAFDSEEGEIIKKQTNLDISRDSWKNFLSKIIRDKSWTTWIKDPDQVKTRTLLAFE